MATLTKVQNYNGSANSYINFGALAGAFPSNSAHTWMVYFRQDSTDTGAFQYLVAKGNTSGEGARLFTESTGGAGRYGMQSSGSSLAPNRSSNSQLTQAQWHCLVAVYDGSGVAASDLRLFLSKNGAAFVEVTYDTGNQADGSGTIDSDAADSFMLGNRPTSLNRWFKGKMAYAARFNAAFTSTSDCQTAFDNGPLSIASNEFCWANGADLKGGRTPTATGSGVTDDTTNLPPNTQLGEAAAPMTVAVQPKVRVDASLTTAITMTSEVRARPRVTTNLTTEDGTLAPINVFPKARVTATLTTAIQMAVEVRAKPRVFASLVTPTTTLEGDFAGANPNMSLSAITNADTMTPTVTIRIRTPDDSEWQQWLFRLNNVRGKTITVEILLAEKEDDPDAYLGTWQGPWWSPSNTAGPSGWNNVSWSQVSGDRVTFTVTPGANDNIFVASLPPWTQDTVLEWINELETAFPTLIHDDLPSRVALGDPSPYVCARSATGVDENGRSITNLPLRGFRIANDSLGSFPKRRIILFSGVHSGEWNGGLQLRGFVNELLTGTYASDLLTRFEFYVYPLHSVKGNYLGFRRNEAAASLVNSADANREWADGDTTLATVVQWQAILDADHGVTHSSKVVGFFDFHDGKNVSNKAWFYHFSGQTNVAAWAAIVAGQNADIVDDLSTIPSGTTSQYFMAKGINFAWTCELADEKSTVSAIIAFGAAYARALKLADDAGLVPQLISLVANVRARPRVTVDLATGKRYAGSSGVEVGGAATTEFIDETGSPTITLPPIYNYNRAPVASQTLAYVVLDPTTATVVASGSITTDVDGVAPPITGAFTVGVAYDVVLRSATVEPGASRLMAA